MAKYKIAWMPGDGVGHDVMEAARIVLDRLKLDAEYVPCDIGWEFWCKEGNALPDRTVEALKETTCALFGAITSKPQAEAKEELAPELKDKRYRGVKQGDRVGQSGIEYSYDRYLRGVDGATRLQVDARGTLRGQPCAWRNGLRFPWP